MSSCYRRRLLASNISILGCIPVAPMASMASMQVARSQSNATQSGTAWAGSSPSQPFGRQGQAPQEGQYWTRAEQQNRPDAPSVWQIGVPLSTSFPFCLYAYPSYLRREEKHHCKRRGSSTGARLHHCSTTHFTDTQLQSLVYLAVGSEDPVLGSIDSLDAFSKFLATRVYNNKIGAPGRIYLRQRPRLISIFNCRQQLQEGSSRNGRLIAGSCFIFQKDCYLGRPSASALGIFSRRLIVLDSHGSSDAGTTIIRTTST
jgi:hypothetical protein